MGLEKCEGDVMSTGQLPTIEHLTPDAKQHLFALLARDLRLGPRDPVRIRDAAGEELLVYAIPIDARERAARALREATPEQRAELRRRAASADNSFIPDL
jgi:hypothetical protein